MGIPASTRNAIIAMVGNRRDGNVVATVVEAMYDLGAQDIIFTSTAAAPVDGTSGTKAGIAGHGSLCWDRTNKLWWVNTNTKASPTWSIMGLQNTS